MEDYDTIKGRFDCSISYLLSDQITDFDKRKLKEGIKTYIEIQTKYNEGDVSYKPLYCCFYQLVFHSSVSEIVNGYFRLLDEKRGASANRNDPSLEEQLALFDQVESLMDGARTKRGSYSVFSTKLVHTIYNGFPIVDKKIKRFFGLNTGTEIKLEQKTIECIINTYNAIQSDFSTEIGEFKNTFRCPDISSTKAIDFIIFFGYKRKHA